MVQWKVGGNVADHDQNALTTLFASVREIFLPLLVVGEDFILQVFLVIQDVPAPLCHRSVFAHPDFFGDLNVGQRKKKSDLFFSYESSTAEILIH